MPDRSLILPGWAVRAVLREVEAPGSGKSQHRGVLKNRGMLPEFRGPHGCQDDPECWGWEDGESGYHIGIVPSSDGDYLDFWQPFAVGDRIWVRETWGTGLSDHDPCPRYQATMSYRCGKPTPEDAVALRWRSSATMPRWASRLTLVVTDVRVQRVQDISEEDARAEGVEPLFSTELAASRPEFHRDPMPWLNYLWHGHHDLTRKQVDAWPHQYSSYETAVGSFSSLWERRHGPGSWARNDWAVAITFRPHARNIDMEADNG